MGRLCRGCQTIGVEIRVGSRPQIIVIGADTVIPKHTRGSFFFDIPRQCGECRPGCYQYKMDVSNCPRHPINFTFIHIHTLCTSPLYDTHQLPTRQPQLARSPKTNILLVISAPWLCACTALRSLVLRFIRIVL